jgi:hypothetical protein
MFSLELHCHLPEAHVKESYEIVGVNPSKQHGSCDKEGLWKLEVKLEYYNNHMANAHSVTPLFLEPTYHGCLSLFSPQKMRVGRRFECKRNGGIGVHHVEVRE